MSNCNRALLRFTVEGFDPISLRPGQKLNILSPVGKTFDNTLQYHEIQSGHYTKFLEFGWWNEPAYGDATFVSWDGEVLTLDVNLTMWTKDEPVEYIYIKGRIHFDTSGSVRYQ